MTSLNQIEASVSLCHADSSLPVKKKITDSSGFNTRKFWPLKPEYNSTSQKLNRLILEEKNKDLAIKFLSKDVPCILGET